MAYFTGPINGPRPINALILWNDSKTDIGHNEHGYMCSVNFYGKVLEKATNLDKCPDSGYVISGHGTSADWIRNNINIGDTLEVTSLYVKNLSKPKKNKIGYLKSVNGTYDFEKGNISSFYLGNFDSDKGLFSFNNGVLSNAFTNYTGYLYNLKLSKINTLSELSSWQIGNVYYRRNNIKHSDLGAFVGCLSGGTRDVCYMSEYSQIAYSSYFRANKNFLLYFRDVFGIIQSNINVASEEPIVEGVINCKHFNLNSGEYEYSGKNRIVLF
jgi:hypothetical protein